ncbi:uncharacterized protein LDX57_003954 [Aspergillus melleus]|uniref:uncharacterized protein n=1 Tax=Aspergillus melleus TaxID=138277 RepID=UPI001E8CA383|nr:uncharacterized protein LDX57_003954 [Aspergillus melleus]KAH8426207.1 hypothetical protein LDX57_003954 [Aspergillus melleus]
MAQDVDHSLLQSPDSQPSLDNRPSGIPSPAKWTSEQSALALNGQHGDRLPTEPFPNGTMDQLSSMSQIPEESEMENGVVHPQQQQPQQQKASRTLPGRSIQLRKEPPLCTKRLPMSMPWQLGFGLSSTRKMKQRLLSRRVYCLRAPMKPSLRSTIIRLMRLDGRTLHSQIEAI